MDEGPICIDSNEAGAFRITSWSELIRRNQEERDFQATLEPSDPRHNKMYRFDDDLGYLDLYWGGYEYSFELDRLDTPTKFLAFLDHVLKKTWRHSTAERVGRLIHAMALRYGWDLHGPEKRMIPAPTARTTADAAERAKVTPKLRYDVLLRDNFRCRACGFGVESGAHLHLDHIHPISKGGRTEFDNLQALCSVCNQGKGARQGGPAA